jgi:hypothetical protein
MLEGKACAFLLERYSGYLGEGSRNAQDRL